MSNVTPIHATPIKERTTGYYVGVGVPLTLNVGWIEISRLVRRGPDGDDKDYEYVIGPLLGETPDAFIVEVYGESLTYSRARWVEVRRGQH